MSDLTYNDYDKKKLIIYGDHKKYSKYMKQIGARWNGRAKNGAGWNLPKEREQDLKNLIESLSTPQEINVKIKDLKSKAKNKDSQKKYHRAISAEKFADPLDDDLPTEIKKESQAVVESPKPEVKPASPIAEPSPQEPSPQPSRKSLKPSRQEPSRQEPSRQEPSRQEPSRQEPSRQEPSRKSPKANRKHTRRSPKSSRNTESSVVSHSPEEISRVSPITDRVKKHSNRKHSESSKTNTHKGRHVEISSRISEEDIDLSSEEDIVKKADSSESSSDSVDISDSSSEEEDKPVVKKQLKYYKKYSKNPSKFNEMYRSDESSSESDSESSENSDSSSDGFPEPETPKKRSTDYKNLFSKVKTLQKKLYEIEKKKKKR